MIFLDSNIPMYLVGGAHPNRDRASALLREAVARRDRLVTSAEVYQELLHRYRGLGDLKAADEAIRLLDELVDEVHAIELDDVRSARSILGEVGNLSSRDALHVAVMRREGVRTVMSFDRGFDDVPRLDRVH